VLRRVFRSDHEQHLIDAYIARLCVLYEDLRIEVFAIKASSIPELDVLDPAGENTDILAVGKYRKNYFLRRSVGTLKEFAEGLRLLDDNPEFKKLASSFDKDMETLWKISITFFDSKEELIKKIRNDIGGHFGSDAAIYAISNLLPDAIGTSEFIYDHHNVPRDPRLHFAGEIAATASLKHLSGANAEEKVAGFIKGLVVEAYRHAAQSVHVLVALYLWPRFGSSQ
jgi:hypothetical protein